MPKINGTQQNGQGTTGKTGAFVHNVFFHCGIVCMRYPLKLNLVPTTQRINPYGLIWMQLLAYEFLSAAI